MAALSGSRRADKALMSLYTDEPELSVKLKSLDYDNLSVEASWDYYKGFLEDQHQILQSSADIEVTTVSRIQVLTIHHNATLIRFNYNHYTYSSVKVRQI
jgi:hypothetical protein